MIEITSFLLRHLYELMADDYDATSTRRAADRSSAATKVGASQGSECNASASPNTSDDQQDTNQQIVLFLAQNHLPDLVCETFIELLFICFFLTASWILVMIVQLHSDQVHQPGRQFYCTTKFLSSLMYCNNKHHELAS